MDLICPWETPIYLIFSSSVPILFYYTYLPILVVSLFFAIFILIKDRYSLQSKILFFIALSFVLWMINSIIQWTSNNGLIQMFSWQLILILEVPIFLLSIYFTHSFLTGKDINFTLKLILFLLALPIITLLPTIFNVSSFYLTPDDCGGNNSFLWDYIYIIEIISIVWIIFYCIDFAKKTKEKESRKKAFLLALSFFFFLGIFFLTGFLGDATLIYQINLIGPLGMALFIAFLSYMIVKYKAFNIKLLATQALTASLWFLVFAILFIRQVEHVRWVVIATLVLLAILGLQLVKSVKREVALREELEIANKNQQSLIGFITHQVKGFFTKSRNIFSMILEEDYGPISPDLKVAVREGFESDTKGVDTVQEILKASNIKKGVISYNMSALDLKPLAKDIFESQKKEGESKGLQMTFDAKDDKYEVNGDMEQMKQALKNLVDNAVKYTLSGSVSVKLERVGGHIGPKADGRAGKIIFSVKDTGVGISKEDFKNLFTEGGRGKDSVKVNVNSTGYGLYIVKNIVDAHGGRIWAESSGENKGSTFFIEFPAKK